MKSRNKLLSMGSFLITMIVTWIVLFSLFLGVRTAIEGNINFKIVGTSAALAFVAVLILAVEMNGRPEKP